MIRATVLVILALLSGSALAGAPACVEDATTACLQGGRFSVSAVFNANGAQYIPPTSVQMTGSALQTNVFDDTAIFRFFDNGAQIDLAVKVLNGCPLNARYWVFAILPTDSGVELRVEDSANGAIRTYTNVAGQPGVTVTDTSAFDSCARRPVSDDAATAIKTPATTADVSAKGVCAHAVCMQGGRFGLDVDWRDFNSNTGSAIAIPDTVDRSGLLWIFDPSNLEVIATVVDGRPDNGSFWFLASAFNNVELTYTLTDTASGRTNTYFQPFGSSVTQLDRGDPISASFAAGGSARPGEPANFTLQLQNDNTGSRDFRGEIPTPAGAINPRFTCSASASASCPAASGSGAFNQIGSIPGGGSLTYRYTFDLPEDAIIGSIITADATTTTMADALAGDRADTQQAQLAVAQISVAIVGPELVPSSGRIALLAAFLLLGVVGLWRLNERAG